MPTSSAKKKRPLKSPNIYLGIDGGGTKTQAVIFNDEKEAIGEGFAGASNPLRVGIETAVANIFQAITIACDNAGKSRGDIVSAVFGLAGVRRTDLRQRLRERMAQKLGIKLVEIVTDAEIALYGTTLGKAGVIVIAGTGSICCGMNESGNFETAGGWGPLAGDEGGGATIARLALQAIAKALDGRGAPTELSAAGMNYFRASTPQNLLIAIYSPQMDNTRIAGFARFVAETAKGGDEVADKIMRESGAELGLAVNAVIGKLNLQNQEIPVGCIGSIFQAGKLITDSLIERVHQFAPKAYLSKPVLQPASAAAQMALIRTKTKSDLPMSKF